MDVEEFRKQKRALAEAFVEKKTALDEELKAFIREKGEPALRALFDAVLQEGITAVVWQQYTPYFNDGDACVFGVGDFYPFTEDTPLTRYTEEGLRLDEAAAHNFSAETMTDYSQVVRTWEEPVSWGNGTRTRREYATVPNPDYSPARAAVWEQFNPSPFEDVLEAVFGDHAEVTATRNDQGEVVFIVEHYDHG